MKRVINFKKLTALGNDYGEKSLKIAYFVIGLMKTNENFSNTRKIYRNNKIYKINNSQSLILFKTIMKHCDCSFELVEKVIQKMIQFKIISRRRLSNSGLWLMSLNSFSKLQWLNFWNSFKMFFVEIYKEYQVLKDGAVQEIIHHPDLHDQIHWDEDEDETNKFKEILINWT